MIKEVHVFRVKPDEELLGEIIRYCSDHAIKTGVVLGIIGSLRNAHLKFIRKLPGVYYGVDYQGPLEIVCAQGSIALDDDGKPIVHIHIQLSRQDISRGGHLSRAAVFSTAEVMIGELEYQLRRKFDSYTGLNELIDRPMVHSSDTVV